ncbi:arsenite efflux ATP-binding protein ArsA [Geodermatophilus saharensis]|uniref:Arsenite efflux ATP-binding protein ArsA n=1 Tax=Geodermatophilus saharensis TaxID=1137994 RepID=A0A239BID4_9ACTN|nr:ArsA-related P-loop ATPase [Geodermatophilus saharensis]SNS07576.1 arsenite efflux ATP-binding protein ArsA [Geodermatophilus saharensis]
MQTLLFTGPGGAGTTTVAAAAAVRAARTGRRVLLVSAEEPPAGTADDGVEVVRADPRSGLERLWAGWSGQLAAAVPDLDLPPATSVVPLPGAGELALLAALGRAAGSGADLVVLDAGPPAAATGLVALPGALRWWLEQALPTRLRMLGAVRTAAVRAGTVRRGAVDVALDGVPALEDLLGRLALADPGATAVRLVAVPRPGAAAALRRATTALAVHGQRPVGVLARVLPDPPAGAGGWWAARAAEQEAELAALAGVAPLETVAESPRAPAGAGALAALLPEVPVPAGAPAAPPLPAPERVEGGWRLALPLPFAERADVTLTRWADDLVVSAAGTRRSLRLDALLRRCVVTAGSLAAPGTPAARLEVGFVADPQLWPADLLAAVAADTGGHTGGETGTDTGGTP